MQPPWSDVNSALLLYITQNGGSVEGNESEEGFIGHFGEEGFGGAFLADALLADAVGAVGGLVFDGGVPPAVEVNDVAGCR